MKDIHAFLSRRKVGSKILYRKFKTCGNERGAYLQKRESDPDICERVDTAKGIQEKGEAEELNEQFNRQSNMLLIYKYK